VHSEGVFWIAGAFLHIWKFGIEEGVAAGSVGLIKVSLVALSYVCCCGCLWVMIYASEQPVSRSCHWGWPWP
jgi:hypothetical protein